MSETTIARHFDRNKQFKATVVFAFATLILMLITTISLFYVEIWEQVAQRSILVAGIIGFILVLLTIGFEAEAIALVATIIQIAFAVLTPVLLGTESISIPQHLLTWLDNSQVSWTIVLTEYTATTAVWIISVVDLWSLRTKARRVFQRIKDHFSNGNRQ